MFCCHFRFARVSGRARTAFADKEDSPFVGKAGKCYRADFFQCSSQYAQGVGSFFEFFLILGPFKSYALAIFPHVRLFPFTENGKAGYSPAGHQVEPFPVCFLMSHFFRPSVKECYLPEACFQAYVA